MSGDNFVVTPNIMDLIYELKKLEHRGKVTYTLQNNENSIEEVNRIFNLKYFEEIVINSDFLILRKYIQLPKNINEVSAIASGVKNNLSAIKRLVEKINI